MVCRLGFGGYRVNDETPIHGAALERALGSGVNLVDTSTGPRGARAKAGAEIDALRASMLADATLAAVGFVINGLRELPGRKGVVLFSDGLSLYETETDRQIIQQASGGGRGRPAQSAEPARTSQRSNTRVDDALRRLVDVANRESVVLYSVDTRGLSTLSLGAQDDVNTALGTADVTISDLRGHLTQRAALSRDTEWGLQAIAQETGGFLLRNQNDLSKGMERVLEDQRGYYLIGYAPDASTFKVERSRPAFHKIKLSVKRPGLQVRSRTGFYGVVDGEASAAPAAGQVPLMVALASPFAAGDVRLHLTSLFVHEPGRGSVLRSLLHLDTHDLSLRETDGALGTTLEILAVTFGDNGTVVDQLARVQEIRVQPHQLEQAHREGLTYRLDVPVKKPGAYQLRVAIRDTATARFGTAHQLVEVPDLGKKRLELSGVVVGGLASEGGPEQRWNATPPGAPSLPARAGARVQLRRLQRAAQRRLADSSWTPDAPRPRRTAALGRRATPDPAGRGQTSPYRGSAFMLGPEMPPGDYVLQLVVTDAGGQESRTATGDRLSDRVATSGARR
jgi:VWFA-related protein